MSGSLRQCVFLIFLPSPNPYNYSYLVNFVALPVYTGLTTTPLRSVLTGVETVLLDSTALGSTRGEFGGFPRLLIRSNKI